MVKPNRLQQCAMIFGVLVLITLGAASLREVSLISMVAYRDSVECMILAISAVKILMITEYFMELRDAPRWLRGAILTWVMATTVVLVSIVLFGGEIEGGAPHP